MVINLLSTQQKKFTRSVYRTHYLISVLVVFSLVLLATLALLVALSITIKQEKENNAEALASLSGKVDVIEFNKLRDEINLVAKYLGVVKANINNDSLTTSYFEEVMGSKAEGIYLNSFDYATNQDAQTIKINGTSRQRQDLLTFTNNLTALPWVKEVDSPVTNLVGDENFYFSLNIILVEAEND